MNLPNISHHCKCHSPEWRGSPLAASSGGSESFRRQTLEGSFACFPRGVSGERCQQTRESFSPILGFFRFIPSCPVPLQSALATFGGALKGAAQPSPEAYISWRSSPLLQESHPEPGSGFKASIGPSILVEYLWTLGYCARLH